ncbi:MAG: cytochrome-c peroxidase [Bacteroidia bacterium]
MKRKYIIELIISSAIIIASCGNNNQQKVNAEKENADKELLAKAQNTFMPLPVVAESVTNPLTAEKTELGKLLYFDTRLSKTGNNSCNSCHNLATYGVDNEPTSPGDAGRRGDRNSPTTFNAALHIAQFWDGRAADVEEQAGGPILNPVEMAMPNEATLIKRLKEVEMYREKFAAAFPNDKDPFTYKNITHAIAAFERTLLTPSKFDDYLKGNINALNDEEKAGLRTFMDAGCTACHSGVTLGGSMYMKFGLINDYRPLTKSVKEDLGRFAVTKNESDKNVFKVPSLRNVTKTYPYFHDGSVATIEDAVRIMGKTQLNKDLNDDEIKSIVTFLETLTSDLPEATKQAPKELALVK